jgi:hypothetical protein
MARRPREIDPNFPKGRLFGSVTCVSTGFPLSGAAIKLQGVSPAVDEVFGLHKLGVTDANGNFDFPAVLASTYYIFSTLPGYASPASPLSRSFAYGVPCHLDDRTHDLDAVLDRVTVTPAAPSKIHLSLVDGGVISGKVLWMDGSPATHSPVSIMHVDRDESRRRYSLTASEDADCMGDMFDYLTDSDGNFHLGGLFPAKYIVGAKAPKLLDYVRKNLMWNGVPPTINCASFYYWTGNTPNLAEATPIEVESGIVTINLTLPMLPEP